MIGTTDAQAMNQVEPDRIGVATGLLNPVRVGAFTLIMSEFGLIPLLQSRIGAVQPAPWDRPPDLHVRGMTAVTPGCRYWMGTWRSRNGPILTLRVSAVSGRAKMFQNSRVWPGANFSVLMRTPETSVHAQ